MCDSRYMVNDEIYFATASDDGTYEQVKRFNGSITVEPETVCFECDMGNLTTFTTNKTITIQGEFVDADLSNILNPGETCKNCGAPVRGKFCEWCGTSYIKPISVGMQYKIK